MGVAFLRHDSQGDFIRGRQMRANTSRGLRLAFDAAAEVYDLGRPSFDAALLRPMLDQAGLKPGDLVLEIGAGSGQLTGGLLEAELQVTALEPGGRLAERLAQKFAAPDRLAVIQASFEDYAPDQRFAAVLASNAFHWVDPEVSYAKAWAALAPMGSLCLIWNFPILADAVLQAKINDQVFVEALAQLGRDPATFRAGLDGVIEAGHRELAETELYAQPWTCWIDRRLPLTLDAYIDLQASYANTVGARDRLDAGLRSLLGAQDRVEVLDHVYLSAARRRSLS